MSKVVKLKLVKNYQSKQAARIMRDMSVLAKSEAFKTVAVIGISFDGQQITAACSSNALERLALIGGLERIKQRLLQDIDAESV